MIEINEIKNKEEAIAKYDYILHFSSRIYKEIERL
jgi:hypothetical protein